MIEVLQQQNLGLLHPFSPGGIVALTECVVAGCPLPWTGIYRVTIQGTAMALPLCTAHRDYIQGGSVGRWVIHNDPLVSLNRLVRNTGSNVGDVTGAGGYWRSPR